MELETLKCCKYNFGKIYYFRSKYFEVIFIIVYYYNDTNISYSWKQSKKLYDKKVSRYPINCE